MNVPIVNHIELLYTEIYKINNNLNKRDKLGIHSEILKIMLKILSNSINAGLFDKNTKAPFIKEIRKDIEILKHLIRIEYKLKIITESFYIKTIKDLEKISIMANGWLKSLSK